MSLNTTYYIIFVFLSIKTVDNYYWVLSAFIKLYGFFDILNPKIIITNIDFSIIYIILEKYLFLFYLLCF